jgi:hypothetical protein
MSPVVAWVVVTIVVNSLWRRSKILPSISAGGSDALVSWRAIGAVVRSGPNYERLCETSEAFILVVMIRLMVRRLASR